MSIFRLLTLIFVGLGLFTTSAYAEQEANTSTQAVAQAPAQEQQAQAKPDANGYYVGGPVYVSDKNKVWTRSGPGEGYRITGSQQVGTKMTFKRYSENGRWAQLELDEQSFWMPLDTLQPNSCGYSREAELTEQVNDLQYKLDNYDNELARSLKVAEDERARLSKENTELKAILEEREQTIQALDEQNRDYADRLQTRELDMQMRWWLQGALIAFAGAIVGMIFIFIPRPTRKHKRERY